VKQLNKIFIQNIGLLAEKLDNEENAELVNSLLIKYGHKGLSAIWLWATLILLKPNEQIIESQRIQKELMEAFKKQEFSEEKLKEVFDDVSALLKKFDFGLEWKTPLITMLLRGKATVAVENFYIAELDETILPDSHRVILVLNPNTTLEEIKTGFTRISKEQNIRNIGKQYKKYTDKSLANLRLNFFRSPYIRMQLAIKNVADELNPYDVSILKSSNKPFEERFREMNKYRKMRGAKILKFPKAVSVRETMELILPEVKRMKPKEFKRLLVRARQDSKRRKRDIS
jgi:hypothetical protein